MWLAQTMALPTASPAITCLYFSPSNPPKPTPQPPTPTEGFAPGGGLPALPASLVEKIWEGSFVDLGDLLPEHAFQAFVDGDDKEKKKRKSHEIETFQECVLGYTT